MPAPPAPASSKPPVSARSSKKEARGGSMKAGSDGEPRGTSRALLAGLVGLLGLRGLAAPLPGREVLGLRLGRGLPRLDWVVPLRLCLPACEALLGRRLGPGGC